MKKAVFGVIRELIDENLLNVVKIENITENNYVIFEKSEEKRVNNVIFKNKREVIEKILYLLMKYKKDRLLELGVDEDKDLEKIERVIKYYLSIEIERVDEVCTDLAYKSVIFEKGGKKYFNMFKTAEVFEKKIEVENKEFKNIEKILRNLCGEYEDYYNYIIDWLAHMIQYPEVRVTNGIIFAGYYVSGKG